MLREGGSTMWRRVASFGAGLVAALLVIWWFRASPEPEVPVVDAPQAVHRTASPTAAGSAEPVPRSPCELELEMVQTLERQAQARLEGRPRPFDDTLPADVRPEAVRKEVGELAESCPGFAGAHVDCSEYPCLVWGRLCPDLDMAPDGTAPWQWVMNEKPMMVDAEGNFETWSLFARVSPGRPATNSRIRDPESARRIAWRVEQGTSALARERGGRAATRRDRAQHAIEQTERWVELDPDDEGPRSVLEGAREALRTIVTAEDALPPVPEPVEGEGCEASLVRARAALAVADAQLYGFPNAAPDDLDPAFSTGAFEARLQASLEACPALAKAYVSHDCTEFPCVVLWRSSDGGFRDQLGDCPAWRAVPTDPAVTSSSYEFVDVEGNSVRFSGLVHFEPGWFEAHPPAAEDPFSERVFGRMERLMQDGLEDLDLRPATPLENAKKQLAWYEERLEDLEGPRREHLEERLEVLREYIAGSQVDAP